MPARLYATHIFRSPAVRSDCRRWVSTAPQRKPSRVLPAAPARTRFAPSPTGYLHLGSLRTALYNYLLAKATGGQFLLRVENTDNTRTVDDAEQRIYDNLRWAGLQWDEGPQVGGPYGPYRQSERREIYDEHAKLILESGQAYRCFCTRERLENLAAERSRRGLPTDYDRTCAGLTKEQSEERVGKGEAHVLRLKVGDTTAAWQDLVYRKVGTDRKPKIPIKAREGYDDPILVKSDGMPTYHFANVIDDHHMQITHVIRAVEWMPSTPKHISIYKAFGWELPQFAHVGLLLNTQGEKLSKRNADTDIQSYINKHYSPEALVNFVALLGWSHQQQSDVLPLEELIKNFSLKFTKGNSIVKLQKLDFLQSQHSQKRIAQGGTRLVSLIEQIASMALERIEGVGASSNEGLIPLVAALLKVDAANLTTPQAFVDRNRYFFVDPKWPEPPPEVVTTQNFLGADMLERLSRVPAGQWEESSLKPAWDDTKTTMLQAKTEQGGQVDANEMKSVNSRLSRYVRWALMGGNPGPPLVASMEILGREKTLARLERSL